MPLAADARELRLLGLKSVQVKLRTSAAATAHAQATDKRVEADALRRSALQTVEASIPLPEQGLARLALFERLRLLAVARAHALELTQHASELDHQAGVLDATAAEHRQAAHLHQRKLGKLEHWQKQQQRQRRRLRDHHHHLELLEDTTCRRRSLL